MAPIDGVEVDISPAPGIAVPVARGPRGLSAYSVALANGFTETEPEWLASLTAQELSIIDNGSYTVLSGLRAVVDEGTHTTITL